MRSARAKASGVPIKSRSAGSNPQVEDACGPGRASLAGLEWILRTRILPNAIRSHRETGGSGLNQTRFRRNRRGRAAPQEPLGRSATEVAEEAQGQPPRESGSGRPEGRLPRHCAPRRSCLPAAGRADVVRRPRIRTSWRARTSARRGRARRTRTRRRRSATSRRRCTGGSAARRARSPARGDR